MSSLHNTTCFVLIFDFWKFLFIASLMKWEIHEYMLAVGANSLTTHLSLDKTFSYIAGGQKHKRILHDDMEKYGNASDSFFFPPEKKKGENKKYTRQKLD